MGNKNSLIVQLLRYTYGVVPIVAGLDKFKNILTDWSHYLGFGFVNLLPFDGSTFMKIVGLIEIIAGILVLIRPKIGSLVVMAWLIGIALTLIFSLRFLDIAVRDLVMAVGAFALYKLSNDKPL